MRSPQTASALLCPCCNLPTRPLQNQQCCLSPAGTGTSALLLHPPSPSALTQGLSRPHDFMLSPEPRKLFKAYAVPPGDGFGCCNACLPLVKRSAPSLPFHPEGEEHISIFKDKKARDSRPHWLNAFSYTLYISWH